MGQPRPPEPVKLIAGVLASAPSLLAEAQSALADEFGLIEAASSPVVWTESTYYQAEMGAVIWRQFLSFADLIDPGQLAPVKRRTNEMEGRWRSEGGRQVNIDPGYLGTTKLVLASTKDAAHRVFLVDGIYAEATLRYAEGRWQPYPYSYRDYASAPALAFFNAVRARYVEQRHVAQSGPGGPGVTSGPPGSPGAKPSRRPLVAGQR